MTSHLATAADRSADWARATPFEPWLAAADDLVELWTSAYDRARVSAEPAHTPPAAGGRR